MFRVTADGRANDASMGGTLDARVEVNGILVCIAKGVALFAADGRELTPAEAVGPAERPATLMLRSRRTSSRHLPFD